MIKTIFNLVLLCLTVMTSCNQPASPTIDQWKQEIVNAEAAFAAMAAKDGIKQAFVAFAAEDAVLMRNNKIFHMKTDADSLFSSSPQNVNLSWSPDFVDVSSSGDLGYTYGGFTYSVLDSLGNEISSSEGIFHTVWKRQPDGSWKYVWD